MTFDTFKIRHYFKTISNFDTNVVFIDTVKKALIVSSNTEAMMLSLDIKTDKEDNQSLFVFEKQDFLHAIKYINCITIDDEYNYKGEGVLGKFKKDSNEYTSEIVQLTCDCFNHKEKFELIKTFEGNLLQQLLKSFIFVAPDSTRELEQYVYIKDNKIFSTSDTRVYLNTLCEQVNNVIINGKAIKFLSSLTDNGFSLYKDNKNIMIENSDLMLFFTGDTIEYPPVLEQKFEEKYKSLFSDVSVTFNNKQEVVDKLDYMTHFSKELPNNFIDIEIDKTNNKVIFSALENKIEVTDVTINNIDCETLNFKFNQSQFLNIIKTLSKEQFTIYLNKDESRKLVVISFNNNEEIAIVAKINY